MCFGSPVSFILLDAYISTGKHAEDLDLVNHEKIAVHRKKDLYPHSTYCGDASPQEDSRSCFTACASQPLDKGVPYC